MKKILMMMIVYGVAASCAYAQGANAAAVAPPPSADDFTNAISTMQTTATIQEQFPELPPSSPCKKQDVLGTWKMTQLHDVPAGLETTDYTSYPLQYIRFTKNSIYKKAKFAARTGRRTFDESFKRQEGDPLQQYLVHDTGFVYFYNEGTVVDTQACFIVGKDFGEFKQYQMLLMPPAPPAGVAVTSRLLKVYDRIIPPRPRQGTRRRR